jgi:hypothetical protein
LFLNILLGRKLNGGDKKNALQLARKVLESGKEISLIFV